MYGTIAISCDAPHLAYMRIVVISDTHLPRFAGRLPAALARVAAERPDRILHCGDLTTLAAIEAFAAIAPVDAVAGNNDGPEIVARFGRRAIVRAGRAAVGIVHGDGAHGTTLGRALAAFADDDVAAICFGHSHIPYLERHGAIWAINPGSVTDKRRQARFSYAVLEVSSQGDVRPRLAFFG